MFDFQMAHTMLNWQRTKVPAQMLTCGGREKRWNFDDDEFDGHEDEREILAMQNELEASRNSILNAAARLNAIVTDMYQTKDDLAQIRADLEQKDANLKQQRANLDQRRAELEQKHANLQEVAGILGTTVDGLREIKNLPKVKANSHWLLVTLLSSLAVSATMLAFFKWWF
ncbi:hypothetical protein F4821DRAFT_274757 [Hypoxylon rubiginosum]|uniref:Uncharacterized protein n=1 Tax=Hypoxylon rubiginosum TaxID=110542 RepID=A0ACC0DD64_9PEZI|nr:hypothetical protein F4821DRAFT_274757 [Hypoxylon rubiginosum]